MSDPRPWTADEMMTVAGFTETFIAGPYALAASPARYAIEHGESVPRLPGLPSAAIATKVRWSSRVIWGGTSRRV